MVPFRYKDGIIQILLIKTRSKKNWITPKGKIEENMTPQESALNEAEEEGGVKGEIIGKKLGYYILTKENEKKKNRILMFSMQVNEELEDYKEKNSRERRWCSMEEVSTLVSNTGLKKIIRIILELNKKSF